MLTTSQNTSLKPLIEVAEEAATTVIKRGRLTLSAQDRDRAVAFGEALRAIGAHVGSDMVSPPSPQLLEVLEAAYRELGSALKNFTPQDFTLYAMSLLLMDLNDEEQIARLKRGAARYLLKEGSHLSSELRDLVSDLRASLRSATVRSGAPGPRPVTQQRVMLPRRVDRGRVDAPQNSDDQSKADTTTPPSIDADSFVFKHAPYVYRPPEPQTERQSAPKTSNVTSDGVSNKVQTAKTRSKKATGYIVTLTVFAAIFATLLVLQ